VFCAGQDAERPRTQTHIPKRVDISEILCNFQRVCPHFYGFGNQALTAQNIEAWNCGLIDQKCLKTICRAMVYYSLNSVHKGLVESCNSVIFDFDKHILWSSISSDILWSSISSDRVKIKQNRLTISVLILRRRAASSDNQVLILS
jgi:hypothetical protein